MLGIELRKNSGRHPTQRGRSDVLTRIGTPLPAAFMLAEACQTRSRQRRDFSLWPAPRGTRNSYADVGMAGAGSGRSAKPAAPPDAMEVRAEGTAHYDGLRSPTSTRGWLEPLFWETTHLYTRLWLEAGSIQRRCHDIFERAPRGVTGTRARPLRRNDVAEHLPAGAIIASKQFRWPVALPPLSNTRKPVSESRGP